MAQFDAIGEEYIRLAFGISQHIDGYVDAYSGPAALRDSVLAQPATPPSMLVAQADALLAAIDDSDYPARRRTYLTKQVIAMATTCRQIAGERFDYRDEIERCFDIVPELIPSEVFEDAIETLQTLLPGNGTVTERMQRWRKQFEVAPSVAKQMIEVLEDELRRRTLALYPLPPQERVEFRLVSDQPWSGYNWYYGGYHSGVDINTDLPIQANNLLHLIAHEAYPGHHTEHCLKEAGLYTERGWAEHSIFLLNTPECVIAEGIANVGETVIFAPGEALRWQAEHIYPLGGIEGDIALEAQLSAAVHTLGSVGGNAALLLHAEGRSEDEVIQYLMRYGLASEARARQRMRFISSPLWRAYIFTYFYGENLMREWLERGDKVERYNTLLREQIYPSLLEGWVLEERASCGVGG